MIYGLNYKCENCGKVNKFTFFKLLLNKGDVYCDNCKMEIILERRKGWGFFAVIVFIFLFLLTSFLILRNINIKNIYHGGFIEVVADMVTISIALFLMFISWLIATFVYSYYRLLSFNEKFGLTDDVIDEINKFKEIDFEKKSDSEIAEFMNHYFIKLNLESDDVLWFYIEECFKNKNYSKNEIQSKLEAISKEYVKYFE